MPRNKYPKETVNRILEASRRLFLEKGYEQTSIQDILDELGDLSKGAIYHHFKSKEDIMLTVIDELFQQHDSEWFTLLQENNDLSGLEKLRLVFRSSVNSPRQLEIFATAPDFLKNSKMLAMQMRSIVESSAPDFIRPIIEQGIADGSIVTDYPEQLAEIILLLVNLWLSPLVFYDDIAVLRKRYDFYIELMRGIGLDLADDVLLSKMEEFWQMCSKKRGQAAN